MGDIIASFFLIILTLGLYGAYRRVTRKIPERRNWIGFISLLIIVGGLIGILLTYFNKRLYDHDQIIFGLTLLFFITQTVASYLYLKFPKVGLPILLFTLILQIPIIHNNNIYYRNQTLLSFNVDNYLGKVFDIEPGSNVSFFYGIPHDDLSLGVNLIPILVIILFLSNIKQRRPTSNH